MRLSFCLSCSAEREAAQAFGVGVRMDPEHFWEELLDDDDDDDDDECMEGIEVGSKALPPEIYQAAMSSFTFAKVRITAYALPLAIPWTSSD